MKAQQAANSPSRVEDRALDQLVARDEVLQICYWYQGEGFGSVFREAQLRPFLNCPPEATRAALEDLCVRGLLQQDGASPPGFRFTDKGRKEAGRRFAEAFSDYQKAGHGECDAGCCDGDDHSQCGDDCAFH